MNDEIKEKEITEFLNKVEKISKEKKIDLSSDEDLSIGIMNLISIEEHLFFTAQKTGKDDYYNILYEVREMRKRLLRKIIKQYEGEVWCISKHLLASSMRLMEVGTKALNKGNLEEAKEYFNDAYMLYSLFWALNMNIVKSSELKEKININVENDEECLEEPMVESQLNEKSLAKNKIDSKEREIEIKSFTKNAEKNESFFSKIKNLVKNTLDCCIE
ncbi:MAG: hypothetical protein QXF76_04120 [Candidatus Anstonellales archaeon]